MRRFRKTRIAIVPGTKVTKNNEIVINESQVITTIETKSRF